MRETLVAIQKEIDSIKNILDTWSHTDERRKELLGNIQGLEKAKIIVYNTMR